MDLSKGASITHLEDPFVRELACDAIQAAQAAIDICLRAPACREALGYAPFHAAAEMSVDR